MKLSKKIPLITLGLILCLLGLQARAAQGVQPKSSWSFMEAGLIPVHSGGRMKPLDSFARESVLFITGARTLSGWDPVDLLFSWMAHPDHWNHEPVIKISNKQLLRQLLLDESKSRFAPSDLSQNPVLVQYAREVMQKQSGVQPSQVVQSVNSQPNAREQELKRVLDRLGLFRGLVSGTALTLIPPHQAGQAWMSLGDGDPTKDPLKSLFLGVLKFYFESQSDEFPVQVKKFLSSSHFQTPGWTVAQESLIWLESFYNRTRPFLWACIFYLLAGLLWLFSLREFRIQPLLLWASSSLTSFAFVCHVLGFAFRIKISGRPPVSNMYESIVWVAFGAFLFSGIIFWIHRQRSVLAAGCIVAGLALIAADAAPAVMDPGIHPLVPVLRSNLWLTIHVLTITLGYAAFALSLGLADAALYQYLRQAFRGDKRTPSSVLQLNELMYRSLQFGVVLLAAGTILGGVWADYSWGRFWGWDPKETWALIALLTYLAVLHGRFAGWVDQFGFSVWTAASFVTVVMAWYGVNFVLGVGLHSYGFSSGQGITVPLLIGLQIAFIGFVWIFRKLRTR